MRPFERRRLHLTWFAEVGGFHAFEHAPDFGNTLERIDIRRGLQREASMLPLPTEPAFEIGKTSANGDT